MATITIRRLNDGLKARLRLRAARHGRSMEEEARVLLKEGLASETPSRSNLAEAIRRHLAPLGGVELRIPKRELVKRPPPFAK